MTEFTVVERSLLHHGRHGDRKSSGAMLEAIFKTAETGQSVHLAVCDAKERARICAGMHGRIYRNRLPLHVVSRLNNGGADFWVEPREQKS